MLKLVFALMTALLVQGNAGAQTATSSRPTPTTTVSTSTSTSTNTTATKKPTNTGEIYRWVDQNGKVQYGSDVPEDRRSTARKVDTKGNVVSSRVPAPAQSGTEPPVARKPVTEREKCEAAWQEYRAAQACFAENRQGTVRGAGKKSGSNVSEGAAEQCPNVVEPQACR
jgi:hypothetical protein